MGATDLGEDFGGMSEPIFPKADGAGGGGGHAAEPVVRVGEPQA